MDAAPAVILVTPPPPQDPVSTETSLLEDFILPDSTTAPEADVKSTVTKDKPQRVPGGLVQWRAELADGAVVSFPGVAESLLLHIPDVAWEMSGVRCRGSVFLTDFRIVLQPTAPPTVGLCDAALPLEIRLGAVAECKTEKSAARLCDSVGEFSLDQVQLRCHDFRCVRIVGLQRPEKGSPDRLESLVEALQPLVLRSPIAEQLGLPSRLFVASVGQPTAHWDVLDWAAEFQRQGVSSKRWRACRVNQQFEVCDSYPPIWWVPSVMSDDDVQLAFSCRARRRGPLLTWHNRGTGSALLRCAQPVGATSDAQYLNCARKAVHEDARLVFFDCRSRLASDMNYVTQGGGVEDPRKYMHERSVTTGQTGTLEKPLVLSFEIPNLHRVRESFHALRELIEGCPSDSSWLASLAKTGWLELVNQLLAAGLTVARLLQDSDRRIVVVHCSDGWDRTSQVVSLAQVLLDPYYRTAEGLAVLVEKDWVAFGHQFEERQFGPAGFQAPIFLQWLFCLAATVQAAPTRFEYSSQDLGLLADIWLSGWSGSLYFNSDRARRDSLAQTKQTSIWAVWLSSREATNFRDYRPWREGPTELLLPAFSLKQLSLWPWCLRFDDSVVEQQLSPSSAMSDQSDVVWWLRDDAAPDCFFCRREFALSRRRHHCRHCGLLFCSVCCTKVSNGRLAVGPAARFCNSCLARHGSDLSSDLSKADENLQLQLWMRRSSRMREPSPHGPESLPAQA